MENELIESELNEYYNLEYEKQNLNDNPNYKKWEESMIYKYGKGAKILYCKNDKIFFSCSGKSLKEYPVYQSICPICKNPICYFCSYYIKEFFENGTCCLRRRILCMFLKEGFRFISPMGDDIESHYSFKSGFIIFIIPFINLLFFIAMLQVSLFYSLILKGAIPNEHSYAIDYENNMRKNHYFVLPLFATINCLTAVLLSINYILLYTYFTIFLLIISIPFKNYPVKYFIGMMYAIRC